MQFLEDWGIFGLFMASFLAATFLPFSSEALFAYMVNEGKTVSVLILVATIGNSLGGLFNYWIGHMGKLEWAQKYLKISKESVDKWCLRIEKHGSLLAFLCWLPIIGDPLALALGYFRVSIGKVAFFLTLGKFIRYLVIVYVVMRFQ
jgi:membrane protein YqaA with SNARE-associated domain